MDDEQVTEEEVLEHVQGEMLCHRCNNRAPVHQIWFKVLYSKYAKVTVSQAVCDECLDSAVASMAAARAMRVRMGERCSLPSLAGFAG